MREVLEETGLCVIRDSIQEYGQVHRIQKGTKEDIEQQNWDKYEADEGFTLEFLEPHLAIDVNRETILDDFTQVMLEREALVLELLIQEGYLKNKGIRTGLISNISYASSVVAERINRLLPENAFEFIITSSNFP